MNRLIVAPAMVALHIQQQSTGRSSACPLVAPTTRAFDAAAGDANTRDHPARVAVPLLMMVTDEEADSTSSHVSSAFEDGDKKLLANACSEQTSGEVDAIDEGCDS
ncbi:hypothetical protein ACHAWO_013858 [Cyclotella atomus]|uniref:Secreted protein n=1 Tax=Cyclotella atomus TaxID=382360 RepID=A0ABD3MVI7_9STRA